jgi:hypothetical protein
MRKLLCLLALVTVLATQAAFTQPASAAKRAADPVIKVQARTSAIFAYDYDEYDGVSGPFAPATTTRAIVKCTPGTEYRMGGDLTQDGNAYDVIWSGALGAGEVICGPDGRITFSMSFYSLRLHQGKATASFNLSPYGDAPPLVATRKVRIPRS